MANTVHRRHAEYFLTLAEESEPRLGGAEQVAWFERLETENDNLRAALSWAIEQGEAELGLRLARALRPFWYARGHYVEGRGWIARFLSGLGELFIDRGDYARAKDLYEEVLALSREQGDATTLVDRLIKLGYVFLLQGNHSEATLLGEEAATESRERGYTAGLARALNCLGWASLLRGDPERASESYEQSLALYKESGDQTIAAESLEGLACAAGARGETTHRPGYSAPPRRRANNRRPPNARCASHTWKPPAPRPTKPPGKQPSPRADPRQSRTPSTTPCRKARTGKPDTRSG